MACVVDKALLWLFLWYHAQILPVMRPAVKWPQCCRRLQYYVNAMYAMCTRVIKSCLRASGLLACIHTVYMYTHIITFLLWFLPRCTVCCEVLAIVKPCVVRLLHLCISTHPAAARSLCDRSATYQFKLELQWKYRKLTWKSCQSYQYVTLICCR